MIRSSTPHGRTAAAAMAAAVLVLLLAPAATLAHAELTTSNPGANATLVDSPSEVELAFTEPVDPENATVDLLDATQRPIPGVGPVEVIAGGRALRVPLPALEPGVYSVRWQVVSTVDGHATEGLFAFLIDPSGAVAPPAAAPASTSPSVDSATIAARWIALAAFLVALGSVVMWWHAGRVTLEREVDVAVRPPWRLVGASALLGSVGVTGYLWLSARPLRDATDGFSIDPAAPYGWTAFAVAMRLAIVAGLATAVLAFVSPRRSAGTDSLAASVGAVLVGTALAGMSAAGHAASAGGPVFAAMDWLHLVAAAAWLGGLPAAFAMAASAQRATGRPMRSITPGVLRRHGRLALVAAPVVALTGIANSPIVLGETRDLVGSGYGNLLLAKGLLLSVAVGIGAANHLWLRSRGRGVAAALIGAELGVALLAVAVAAAMVTIQPASARQATLSAPSVNPAHLFGQAGPSRVHVTVSLPSPGDQTYQVTVTDAERGGPREDVEDVFLRFVPPPDSGLPAEQAELDAETYPGLYVARGEHTPVEGEWTLEVVVRRQGAPDETVAFALPVESPSPAELVPPPDTGIGVPAPLGAAWDALPSGLLGWLPAGLALAGLAATAVLPGRVRRAVTPVRAALITVALVAGLSAGTRDLVAAANRPPADLETAASPAPASGDSIERGEAIYRANCAACHGTDGQGDGPVTTHPDAGPLPEVVAGMPDAELSYRISHGIAGTSMPAFAGRLTAEERWDLIRYLRERWGGEP